MRNGKNNWGPGNAHPLSRIKTELVWDRQCGILDGSEKGNDGI